MIEQINIPKRPIDYSVQEVDRIPAESISGGDYGNHIENWKRMFGGLYDEEGNPIGGMIYLRPPAPENQAVPSEITEHLYPDRFQNHRAESRLYNNTAIEWMVNSGPDFLKNLWDVTIVCTKINDKGEIIGWQDLWDRFYENPIVFGSPDTPKFMGDCAMFMVRVQSIDVPQSQSETFETPMLYMTLKKVRSKVNFQRKSQMSILVDEPMHFINIFNLISNNNRITPSLTVRPLLNVPFTTLPLFQDNIIRKKVQMNILVQHRVMMRHYHYDLLRQENQGETYFERGGLHPDQQPFWVFEDVNFTGVTSKIDFKNDTANTLEAEIPFLFKRLYKVDRQPKLGQNYEKMDFENLDQKQDVIDSRNNQKWYYGD